MPATEANDRAHLRSLLADAKSTVEAYNVIAIAMHVCGAYTVGEYLGKYANYEAQYRHILDMHDAVATALHKGKIIKKVAVAIAAFRHQDQPYLLAMVLEKFMPRAAVEWLEGEFAKPEWVKPVRPKRRPSGEPWPKKNLEAPIPTLATVERPKDAPEPTAPAAAQEEETDETPETPEPPETGDGLTEDETESPSAVPEDAIREKVPDDVAAVRKAEKEEERQEILRDIKTRFVDTTEGARQGEQLPPHVASSLFNLATPPNSAPAPRREPIVPALAKPRPAQEKERQAEVPSPAPVERIGVIPDAAPQPNGRPWTDLASDEAKVNGAASLLQRIADVANELKHLSALDLETIARDPLDYERLKRLCRKAGNGVCFFEELLDVAANQRDR